MRRPEPDDSVGHQYFDAKRCVIDSGYAWEIDLQEVILQTAVSEEEFLQELAWVILSSGFRETVLRRHFPRLRQALGGLRSFDGLLARKNVYRRQALKIFGHRAKIDAIFTGAALCRAIGLSAIIAHTKERGPTYLTFLPFIGPVTAFHLAKNIGFEVVKPDRHLARISDRFGFNSPAAMCEAIRRTTGEQVAIIDTVLWRFGVLRSTGT